MSTKASLAAVVFISAAYAVSFAQSKATVTTADTKLLKDPVRGSALLKSLDIGDELKVEDTFLDEQWAKVRTANGEGWVPRNSILVRMDDPWEHAIWLFIGASARTNGFVARFYLNTSQIVRRGDDIKFWTRTVTDNKKAYFQFLMDVPPKRTPEEFRFNADLWDGNCDSEEIRVVRSLLFWHPEEVTRPRVERGEKKTANNSAAKLILEEACRVSAN